MKKSASSKCVRDFDAIALLADDDWDASSIYYPELLPERCGTALDLGCGNGGFTRLLSARAERVVGLDASPRMIEVARRRCADLANVEFVLGDALDYDFSGFDCIVSIATLHHMPLEAIVPKLRAANEVRIMDLRRAGFIENAIAFAVATALRLRHTGRPFAPRAVREAWREHGEGETYMTFDEAQRKFAELLPGCVVERKLLWRYTMTWRDRRPRLSGRR